MPRLSVVVPARNSQATLPACLDALEAQSCPRSEYEVIVVDDGSTDATADVVRRYPGVRLVSIAPSGPAAARNRGIEAAAGELVLFTDADCVPSREWMERLASPLSDPQVAAAKGVYRSEQSAWTARFVQCEYESRYERMRSLPTIDFIDTYSAAYRRDVLVKAGGFDESFPVACVEDQELSFRLGRAGARMVFTPEAVVRHLHADTPRKYFQKKRRIGYWKVRVLRRFPGKALGDSHTPSALKAEVLLAALGVAGAVSAPFSAWWVPLVPWAGFAMAAAPLCRFIARRDPALALRAPGFIVLRALALGAGMIEGVLKGGLRRSATRVGVCPESRDACAAQHARA